MPRAAAARAYNPIPGLALNPWAKMLYSTVAITDSRMVSPTALSAPWR